MSKKYIQFPSFLFPGKNKPEAIAGMEEYVNEHAEEFRDGEEITIKYYNKYYDETGNTVEVPSSCNAVIHTITENNEVHFKVYAEVGEDETVKIVDGEEPEDKEVLWLDEVPGDQTTSGLTQQILDLKAEIRDLKKIIERHDYALSSTLAGGDIITNSEKYNLENAYTPEQPADAIDTSVYATDEFTITDFDVYLGNTPFYDYARSTDLYVAQNYNLKIRLFNFLEQVIKEEDAENLSGYTALSNNPSVATFKPDTTILRASQTGSTTVFAQVTLTNGQTLSKDFSLTFQKNEDPYYERYEEPNVHHVLIKSAETYDILAANINYLCAPEFVWCVENNTLYLRAKTSNGSIQVVKISGGGEIITGDTSGTTAVTATTYVVDDNGDLIMSGKTLTVDEEGILIISGATVDSDDILILNNTSGTPTPTPSGVTITFNVDSNGDLIVTGDSLSVDNDGYLVIGNGGTVDSNGEIDLNNT